MANSDGDVSVSRRGTTDLQIPFLSPDSGSRPGARQNIQCASQDGRWESPDLLSMGTCSWLS